jgi:hypothetical protein
MVASVQALLEMIESAIQALYRSFACLSPLLGSRGETRAISKLYERIEEVNFSHHVLALRPKRLAVVKVAGVRWNDLGEPKRVMASLNMAFVPTGSNPAYRSSPSLLYNSRIWSPILTEPPLASAK